MAEETVDKKRRRAAKPKPDEAVREQVEGLIRDRIVDFRRVPAAELEDNAKNWRTHPYAQKQALSEVLDRIGIAGVLTAYHSERNGGKLTLIDGHERRSHEADWPTVILDVSDEEADLLLLTLDPITGLAGADGKALAELLASAGGVGTPGLEDLMQSLALQAGEETTAELAAEAEEQEGLGPPEMELQAFEHYDYVIFLFSDALDWRSAKDLLGLKEEAFTLKDGKTRRTGLGRVADGKRLLELLKKEMP